MARQAEFEQVAVAFAVKERAAQQATAARRESVEQQAKEATRERREAYKKEAFIILGKLRVSQSLIEMRDEKWGEGHFEEIDQIDITSLGNREVGLRLVSDPIPSLRVRDKKVDVDERTTSLSVTVRIPPRFGKPQVEIKDSGLQMLDRLQEDPFSLMSRSIDTLWSGLDSASFRDDIGTVLIDPEQPNAYERYCDALAKRLDHRREYKALPAEIRAWETARISKMPEAVKNGGLQGPALRVWHDRMVDAPKVVYLFHRAQASLGK